MSQERKREQKWVKMFLAFLPLYLEHVLEYSGILEIQILANLFSNENRLFRSKVNL